MFPFIPYSSMGTMLFALLTLGCLAVSLVSAVVYIRRRKRYASHSIFHLVLILFCCLLAIAFLAMTILTDIGTFPKGPTESSTGTVQPTSPSQTVPTETDPPHTSEPTTPTAPPTEPPIEPAPTLGDVSKTKDSDPTNWNVQWDIIVNEAVTDSYGRGEAITLGDPNTEPYFALPGISTFRGDHYRSGAVYGTCNLQEQTLTAIWKKSIGSLPKQEEGLWTGSGWTGQPLMVQWDAETRDIMNLYEDKKSKENLVEVIYATLDGHIYFYDLEDGTYTRDPIYIGMAFKGSGALDPRGYPILYVGSGDITREGQVPRMYIISLIDGSILYTRGNTEPLAKRAWIAFDSSPLVDAETDTLIWPGESGILYTIKLNTNYHKESGTLTVAPDSPVMTRYTTGKYRSVGYESSCIIVENYIYIADNGGMIFCVDLNTMELVWAQYTKDDTNATPVFEWGKDGRGYLYTATSMEYAKGNVYICKLDAATGEILWEVEYSDVYYDDKVSGGVLSSPVLGKAGTALEGMIFYSIAKTPDAHNGILMALDTATGEVIWQQAQDHYSWSSPLAIYGDDGSATLLHCDSAGNIHLIDPTNGQIINSINIGSNIEASPAVFEDMLVVGTRGQQVYGIKLL